MDIKDCNFYKTLNVLADFADLDTTVRCKSWKILSINWLNIARTNIEPKNTVQLIENGITHYYIAYCISLLRLFHQNSYFSHFL